MQELEPKLWTKVEPEPKINNFGSATLLIKHEVSSMYKDKYDPKKLLLIINLISAQNKKM